MTDHEDTEGENRYSFKFSLTSALDGGVWVRHPLSDLLPGKRPGAHSLAGWLVPSAGLELCRKFRPHRDSIPEQSSPSQSLYRLC